MSFGFVKVILEYFFLEDCCSVPVIFDLLCNCENLKPGDGGVSLQIKLFKNLLTNRHTLTPVVLDIQDEVVSRV